ncbi:hypothetical protein MGSAQ_000270 [marine sediment metagenome]|uniref:Uncharacterized protein n=1 Tax=marine sediment metagenome TaxID=412755 RepID=A0A1B6NXV1_9ZZZZ
MSFVIVLLTRHTLVFVTLLVIPVKRRLLRFAIVRLFQFLIITHVERKSRFSCFYARAFAVLTQCSIGAGFPNK